MNKNTIDRYVQALMKDEDYQDFTMEELEEIVIDLYDDLE